MQSGLDCILHIEIPIVPSGRPSHQTANQVTKTLTINPIQGPVAHTATIRSLEPTGLPNRGFFDKPKKQENQ
jgi:hypothetical protein